MSENSHNAVSFILSCVSLRERTLCQSGNSERLVDIDNFSFI